MSRISPTSTTGIRRRRATVNNVELDLLESGEAGQPLVILSHGFPEAAYSWRHQLPALAGAGYHAIAPDQRGYGRSSRPGDVASYGIENLCDDLIGLVDEAGQQQAVFVGHDWGALIVWDLARIYPDRVKAVVGVSVPFISWPAPPTQLMKAKYQDRFFYILYFQQVGPAEAELGKDPRDTMARVLWGSSSAGHPGPNDRPVELPAMAGTGFLSRTATPPALGYSGPEGVWLTESDLATYTDLFGASGFFGPVSYYRNLDANYETVKNLGIDRMTMPVYFIGGSRDLVITMDPRGVSRMQKTLPNFRGHTIIDDVGHWTQQEAPKAFNKALLDFLATLPT